MIYARVGPEVLREGFTVMEGVASTDSSVFDLGYSDQPACYRSEGMGFRVSAILHTRSSPIRPNFRIRETLLTRYYGQGGRKMEVWSLKLERNYSEENCSRLEMNYNAPDVRVNGLSSPSSSHRVQPRSITSFFDLIQDPVTRVRYDDFWVFV